MRLKLKSNTIFKMACCPSKMVNCGIVQVGFPMETAIFQIKANRNFSYNTRLLSFKVKPKVDRIFAEIEILAGHQYVNLVDLAKSSLTSM